MKTKLFNQLKQAYASKYGVADEILQGQAEALAATGLVTDENIATVIQGQENVFRAIQTKFDKTVTSYKKELDELKTKKVEEVKPTEEVPAYIQQMIDGQKALSDKILGLESEKIQTSLSSKLVSSLNEKKIPESYYSVAIKGRNFKDENEIMAFAGDMETAYTIHKQGLKDIGFSETIPPQNGSVPVDNGSQIAQLLNNGTKQIIEQKK